MNTDKISLQIDDVDIQVPRHMVVESVLAHISRNKSPYVNLRNAMPLLGEMWEEEGGLRIGEMRMGKTSQTYQLILPKGVEFEFSSTWGCDGKEISGADSAWDGISNTQAMMANGSDLAKKISIMESCGHRDLYLPSRDEARLVFINGRDEFKKDWHWTSTQYSSDSAFGQHFDDGSQGTLHKDYDNLVRPVRRKI